MSYETHVTMAINCITTSIYVYAVFELITVCLSMIIIAAKTVPPTDFLSMLFNLWFGIMTFAIVAAMRSLISSLFFYDASKQKLNEPACTFIVQDKAGNASKLTVYDTNYNALTLPEAIAKLNIAKQMSDADPSSTGSKPSEPAQTAQAANSQSTQPPKSPGTPDSEERSQADTEGFGDAQGEINGKAACV